ncbi:MAG: hypothetical protein CEE40_07440 [Chloroflexi bacterium B3_Chlor]|nr:MAG: hypothetical protein CEE40_07440 [Chloroflexi bacterium B3_Chlor]
MASKREIVFEIVVGRLWVLLILVALVGGLALASVVWAAPEKRPSQSPLAWMAMMPGSYYLTDDTHDGNEALVACAAGYHMAALWEIWDVSNMTYNTSLGYQIVGGDQGDGPPTDVGGWVRTGSIANTGTGAPGTNNCGSYTQEDGAMGGTVVSLPNNWSAPTSTIGVWEAGIKNCDSFQPVWCVRGPLRGYLPLILRNY